MKTTAEFQTGIEVVERWLRTAHGMRESTWKLYIA